MSANTMTRARTEPVPPRQQHQPPERDPRSRHRDLRWNGQAVRVHTPVPTAVWTEVAAADPTAMPFQTPLWRDCVVAGSVGGRGGRWGDASRLYETADGRQLVLMMARRSVGPGLFIEASWPAGGPAACWRQAACARTKPP
jgi:hypothetical protein